MSSKKYTVQYFIRKFSRIPENKWTRCSIAKQENGATCVLGHVGVTLGSDGEYLLPPEAQALCELLSGTPNNYVPVYRINDHQDYKSYKEGTMFSPKQNILAALDKLVIRKKKTKNTK